MFQTKFPSSVRINSAIFLDGLIVRRLIVDRLWLFIKTENTWSLYDCGMVVERTCPRPHQILGDFLKLLTYTSFVSE